MPSTRIKSKKGSDGEKKRLVVLDMHAILHRAYHALPEFTTSKGEPSGALYGLAAMLLKIITDLKPDYIAAAYDLPKPTHRHEAFKDYKAKRVKPDDSLIVQIERSREVLAAFDIPVYEHEGFEADDVIGSIAEALADDPEIEVVIASGDMDTLQLVDKKHVKVFTLRKGMSDTILYGYDDVVARYGFPPELLPDFKGLRGDPSDNIPGIRGIGEKTATTLITAFGDIDSIYKHLESDETEFDRLGITPRIRKLLAEGKEDAHFSKLLGTIRKDAPIAFAMPKHSWRETVSASTIIDMLTELEFRSLVARAKTIIDGPQAKEKETKEELFPAERADITQDELKETQIALALLNPELARPTADDILAYAQKTSLREARESIMATLGTEGLRDIYETIERPLIKVIEAMIGNGIRLDISYLKLLSEDYHKELDALQARIWKHAGKEFNINSPRQLAEVLFEGLGLKLGKKTSTGQRSTRESELAKLKDTHPIINEIVRYRELQKLLSTYIDAFPKMIGPDGRLHTTFVQIGAATGRMSSQSPNLQNIPIRTEVGRAVRGAFVAQSGYLLVSFDYSQIELRIAAILSGDEKLVKTFKEGGDIHTAVASEIFDVPPEDVTPNMRRTAKVINFGVIYGMGANALAATAGMTRSEAQKYLADYEKTFTGLARYMSETIGQARREGSTMTMFGRKRYLPGIRSPLPHIQAENERQAINAPLQGTSADIIKLAMVRIDEMIRKERKGDDVRLALQIHDELMYEIKEELIDDFAPRIKRLMETVVPEGVARGVPILADVSVGKRWSEMKRLE